MSTLSAVGIAAAESLHRCFADGGIEYVDTPVSGGTAGAAKGTISTMYAGSAETLERLRQAFATMSKHVFHIGDTPGQGQAIKLLNNFLSAVAMAATSEAVAFGVGRGVSMRTILDVLNVSTGRNTATSDKFPNRILTETYDAGFTSTLLTKDPARASRLETGESTWIARQRAPQTTGTLVTAGGLVFAGALDRRIAAYDAGTGEPLWQTRLNEVPSAAPITYGANGRQYVAVIVGSGGYQSGSYGVMVPEIKNPPDRGAALWVFELK